MDIVLTSAADGVGTITMNRADKRNALSAELVAGLHAAFLQMGSNESVKVIVLSGEGSAFCAGADLAYLQQITENSPLENLADSTALKDMLQSIVDCPKPVIAKVHGAAIAGGCGLATVCDIVIAGREKSLFGYSEVRIGFIPAIVLVYLVRKIGDTQSRRLVLTAENINAEEALRLGLITKVVNDEDLEAETMLMARQIAKNSSSAMAMSKMMLGAVQGMSLDAGLHYATVMNALARQTDDCKQGIATFLKSPKG
ncbi:MAG: enoyl-CoA hydratase/isomerase family protein [Ignavibacteria bacterium]|nr:enoyl-CoA hydratase/isomerase family protein [Ignavibacteria bacterium]MBP6509734.1 enoyl-CoA hydratase/isomerase family protein [Candidatus Kapabacteria bacterium]MBK6420068.1 enoyl-CoA hydratase/isomerase family protein [Ignavibacteria bacterium]MBK7034249.1 enoyl-CoA hydratase/isomerase family protein [Ignavibacteria bacterium]MBK7185028.1 enoyl-CoA hydratase/isomerase family protein [Ignavibacteria bacterium]